MPATSKAQQRLFAVAEHSPSKLYRANRGLLNMSHQQLHDYAATATKGLPARIGNLAGMKKKKTK